MTIIEIHDNQKRLKQLLSLKSSLVPFLGAGFSRPACPTWADFLMGYFQSVHAEFLLPEEEEKFNELKESVEANKYELIADFLISKSGRKRFEEEIKKQFDKPLLLAMKNKFNLLHSAFQSLKITTNFDCLIENNSGDTHVNVCHGDHPQDLERLFTRFDQNSLLKIHGGLGDIPSIILSTAQYAALYGHEIEFDPHAPLPLFLERVFTNCSVLFIGCSLSRDRTLMVLEHLRDVRLHFGVMLRPTDRAEVVKLNRRLSQYGITPIWITDFEQIEQLLQLLAPEAAIAPLPSPIDHGVTFVGREKELEQIKERLLETNGGVQMISGHLFSLDGAGGVGKTTLAIEVAKQCAFHFKDGVIPPIRVDEHNPMSFVMHLASQFNLTDVEEPADPEAAQGLVTAILRDRHALVILDNASNWIELRRMLPTQTRSTILVTTRNRDIYRHLRLHCREMAVGEIPLKNFNQNEALQLFQKMLGGDYSPKEEDTYLGIAENLGFLPLALRQAISLMLFGPHYPAVRLLEKLKSEDRLALLKKGQAAEGSDSRTIETVFDLSSDLLSKDLTETMEYLAVCAPGPVPLSFLQQLIKGKEIDERLEQLYTFSWCERREISDERYYGLHQLVRELVQKRFGKRFSHSFIELNHRIFTDENIHFSKKEPLMSQLNEALAQAATVKDKRLIDWLYDLYDFCTYRGYIDFYVRITEHAEQLFRDDQWTLRTAHAHQALILKAWGKLDKAMELHKKEEKICEELGDRAGLARSYGNQALILKAWGKLDKAMELHKKEEKICEELGDRAGLAICWWNQGSLYGAMNDLKKNIELWQKSIAMSKSIGIPIEEDEKVLKELMEKS